MLIPVPAYSHQLLSLIISQRKEAILDHGQITHHLGRRSSSEATGFSRVAASQHYTRRLLPYAYDVRLLVGLVLVWGFPWQQGVSVCGGGIHFLAICAGEGPKIISVYTRWVAYGTTHSRWFRCAFCCWQLLPKPKTVANVSR